MSNYEELPDDIRKQIGDFEGKIGGLKVLKGSAREEAVVRHEKHAKRIHRLLQTYQYSIQSGSFQRGVETHKSQLKEFEQQLARLEKNLEAGRNDMGAEEDLFKHRGKSNRNVDTNNVQAIIEMGDQGQKDIGDALDRIDKNVLQMDEQADTLIVELDRQIQKLDHIYEELNDTESTLKRAEKHLKYFAKQIYTDRIMICLIITIAIAIIVIIALAIAGKTPKVLNGAK